MPGAQAGSRVWSAHPPEPLGTPPLVSPPQAAGAGPPGGTGPILYAVCTLLALVQFWVGVAGFAALVALYLVPPPQALAQAEADGAETTEPPAGGAGRPHRAERRLQPAPAMVSGHSGFLLVRRL